MGKHSLIIIVTVISIFGTQWGRVSPAFASDSFLTSPLPVRNMHPPMMRFFDPVPDSALRDYSSWDLGVDQHISSVYQFNQWPLDRMLVDMELYVADVTLRKSLSRDMDISLRLTLMRPFNGLFDPLVKSFHELISAPSAGRQFRPNNAFAYYFRPGNGAGWQGENRWEMGDAVLSLRKQLLKGETWAIAALAAVKLPVASKSRGWGSGQPDAALGAVASFNSDNWFMHMEAWGIKPFMEDVPGSHFHPKVITPYVLGWQHSPYMRGSLTLGWKQGDQLSYIIQMQGGTSPYTSGMLQLDSSLMLISFGLQGETESKLGWSFVFTENGLNQLTTQDITLSMALHYQFPD